MAMDLPPGSIFVHRNLGGLVNHKDLNAMSCLEYALVLGVKHVIVSGHYNCGTRHCMLDRGCDSLPATYPLQQCVGLIGNTLR